jgi:hypothetical protein
VLSDRGAGSAVAGHEGGPGGGGGWRVVGRHQLVRQMEVGHSPDHVSCLVISVIMSFKIWHRAHT